MSATNGSRQGRRLTSLHTKKAVNIAFRSSEGFKAILIHTGEVEGKDLSAWLLGVALDALRERGIQVPADLPEYDEPEAPEGSRNFRMADILADLAQEAKTKAEPWASAAAESELMNLARQIRKINNPSLWNEVHEVCGWKGRTARQKVHALKFRMQKYQE
jgi:hypothetical protein